MKVILSWDLFILVFFFIIGSYSFIVGRHRTMKVLLGAYISLISADALGNLLQIYVIGEGSLIIETISVYSDLLGISLSGGNMNVLILLKIFFFMFFTILLTISAPFEAMLPEGPNKLVDFLVHLFFSLLSGLFIVTVVLRFLLGIPVVGTLTQVGENNLYEIAESSNIMKMIVYHFDAWFLVPAIFILLASLIPPPKE